MRGEGYIFPVSSEKEGLFDNFGIVPGIDDEFSHRMLEGN